VSREAEPEDDTLKHIVEAHGGTATADSAETGEARRSSKAPDRRGRRDTGGISHALASTASPTSLSGLRVLVVDDDESSRDVVAQLLAYHHVTRRSV
jgi:PleD family two-component response regulator